MNLNDLSESDYARIGKLLKARFNKWHSNTDVEVGVVHYKRGEVPPDILAELISLDVIPTFGPVAETNYEPINISSPLFPGLAANRQEKAIRYVRACYETELTARRSAHELAHQDENLRRSEYLSWIQNIQAVVVAKSTILTTQATAKLTLQQTEVAGFLTREAAKTGMDLPTYMIAILDSERSRLKVEEDAYLKNNERTHKAAMDALAREDDIARAQSRIQVATTASMADLQQEQQVLDALDKARVKRHTIESGNDNATLKAQRLEDQDEYIESLKERLRGFRKSNRQADSG